MLGFWAEIIKNYHFYNISKYFMIPSKMNTKSLSYKLKYFNLKLFCFIRRVYANLIYKII
jgi:hypothetical protein